MKSESTPKEVAKETSPILAVLSAIATLILLYVLDDLHLWALAILVGLIMETLSFFIIRWAVEKVVRRREEILSQAISSVQKAVNHPQAPSIPSWQGHDNTNLTDWANQQVNAIRQLRKQDSFRKEFIGNLAHELKTPLFNIQGFILTLLEGDLDNSELNRNFLSKAAKNVSRMTELLEDLDAINKLESDSLKMPLEPADILELVKEVMGDLESKAKHFSIQLTLCLTEKELSTTMVLCGPRQINQVLTNLVANSIHYGRPDGETTITLKEEGNMIRLTVEDNGIGIAEKDLPRIYERFYRIDKSRSRNSGGSGLGLSIVKHILDAHGQEVQVQSAAGEGTRFSFCLLKLDNPSE